MNTIDIPKNFITNNNIKVIKNDNAILEQIENIIIMDDNIKRYLFQPMNQITRYFMSTYIEEKLKNNIENLVDTVINITEYDKYILLDLEVFINDGTALKYNKNISKG